MGEGENEKNIQYTSPWYIVQIVVQPHSTSHLKHFNQATNFPYNTSFLHSYLFFFESVMAVLNICSPVSLQ